MQVETHDRLGSPTVTEATRLVVRDSATGDVVLVCLEHAPGAYWIRRLGDPGFEEGLARLGVKSTTVVDRIDPATLEGLGPPG